jgi:hypothetical protein
MTRDDKEFRRKVAKGSKIRYRQMVAEVRADEARKAANTALEELAKAKRHRLGLMSARTPVPKKKLDEATKLLKKAQRKADKAVRKSNAAARRAARS